MQFLVYLVLLTVSVSTVLLEVHWLTSPAPQPRPIAQASSPPVSKTEGSDAALRPVYQQKPDAPRSANVQTQIRSAAAPQPAGQDAPASPTVPTAPPTPVERVSPTTQSPAAQQPGTEQPIQQPAAAPQSHQAALPQAPTSRFRNKRGVEAEVFGGIHRCCCLGGGQHQAGHRRSTGVNEPR